VGLPGGSRRRTPGLRREELALLAGIGVTWYTSLEQGHAIMVSTQVLESLARVLDLNAAERNHLFLLAREQQPADPYPSTATVSPALQRILVFTKSGQGETVCFGKNFRPQVVSRLHKTMETIAIKWLHEPLHPASPCVILPHV